MRTDEFAVMVDDIAIVILRYEGRVTPTAYEVKAHRRRDAIEWAIGAYDRRSRLRDRVTHAH